MAVNNIETFKQGTEGIHSPNTQAGEVDGIEFKVEYSDLGCDTVKFDGDEYKKVY